MSLSAALYRLQQFDSELDAAKKRLDEIDKLLKDHRALELAARQHEQAIQAMNQAEQELKAAEQLVAKQQNKIDNNQRALYSGSVKNPKELEDLQNEAAALKRYLETLEENQLEKLIALEEEQAKSQHTAEILANAQKENTQKTALLNGERSTLLETSQNLNTDRQAASITVPTENLALYERLREKKNGRAVSAVKDKVCTSCGAQLTAAQAQESRSPVKVTCCDNCGRILHNA